MWGQFQLTVHAQATRTCRNFLWFFLLIFAAFPGHVYLTECPQNSHSGPYACVWRRSSIEAYHTQRSRSKYRLYRAIFRECVVPTMDVCRSQKKSEKNASFFNFLPLRFVSGKRLHYRRVFVLRCRVEPGEKRNVTSYTGDGTGLSEIQLGRQEKIAAHQYILLLHDERPDAQIYFLRSIYGYLVGISDSQTEPLRNRLPWRTVGTFRDLSKKNLGQ